MQMLAQFKENIDMTKIDIISGFAHAASVSVAEEPATEYNPLFIHGGAGLGKTHLMQAIAHHIIDTRPDFKVLYVTSETFTNEIIKAIGDRNVEKFREKYRNVLQVLKVPL